MFYFLNVTVPLFLERVIRAAIVIILNIISKCVTIAIMLLTNNHSGFT